MFSGCEMSEPEFARHNQKRPWAESGDTFPAAELRGTRVQAWRHLDPSQAAAARQRAIQARDSGTRDDG
jgi:hypothetical protein